jgi:hypothetical protein
MTVGIVAKRSEEELGSAVVSEVGFITSLFRYDDAPISLEPYQVSFLNNRSRFRLVSKSRQVGFSWLNALEALARCHLRDGIALRRWSLSRAWPVQFVAGDWDNESDENVIESVTLTFGFLSWLRRESCGGEVP